MKTSKVLEAVINDMTDREKIGISKYGTTLDRNDLSKRQWMQHHYEELLDAALYVKKQIMMLEGQERNPSWNYDMLKIPTDKLVRLKFEDDTELFGCIGFSGTTYFANENGFAEKWNTVYDKQVVAWKEIRD